MSRNIVYQLGKKTIRIRLTSLILFLLFQTGLNELGFWQLAKAQEKQTLQQAFGEAEFRKLDSYSEASADTVQNFPSLVSTFRLLHRDFVLSSADTDLDGSPFAYVLVEEAISHHHFLLNLGQISAERIPHLSRLAEDMTLAVRIFPLPQSNATQSASLQRFSSGIKINPLNLTQLEDYYRLSLQPVELRLIANLNPDSTNPWQDPFTRDWQWHNLNAQTHLYLAMLCFVIAFMSLLAVIYRLVQTPQSENTTTRL